MKKNLFKNFYIIYSLAFCLLAVGIFIYYPLQGRTLVWKNDGYMQSYRAMLYLSQSIRDSIRVFLSGGGLSFENFYMAIGEGDDVITSLSYYCVGDPFLLPAILVPASKLYIYYSLAMLLKMYLAGLFFSWLLREAAISSFSARLCGSLLYAFSFWAILNAGRHPFFLTPLVFFPLLLCGIERVIEKGHMSLLAIGTALCAVSNFYLFVSVVILTILYVAVRLLWQYGRNFKELLGSLGRIFAGAVTGSLIGMVILLPNYMVVLSSARVGGSNTNRLLYPWSYYLSLPGRLLSSHDALEDGFWTCLGFTGLYLAALALCFAVKKSRGALLLKILNGLALLMLLFPLAGRLMNGMTYVTNRWCCFLSALAAYTIAWAMERAGKEELCLNKGIFAAFLAVFSLFILLIPSSRGADTLSQLLLSFLVIIGIILIKRKRIVVPAYVTGAFLTAMTLLTLLLQGFFFNSSFGSDYASEGKSVEEVRDYINANDAGAVREYAASLGDESFYRIGSEKPTLNSGFTAGISALQHYWSVGNSFVPYFREKLSLTEGNSYNYKTDDKKAIVMALACTKYYTIPTGWSEPAPYGYEKKEEIFIKGAPVDNSRYDIYESENALPLGYSYGNLILQEEWENLDPAEKQEAMLYAAILPQGCHIAEDMASACLSAEEIKSRLSSRKPEQSLVMPENDSVKYSCDDEGGLVFEVSENEACIEFSLEDSLPEAETYVYAAGISYEPYDGDTMYQGRKSSVYMTVSSNASMKGIISYRFTDDAHYDGRDTYMENTGYSREAPQGVYLTFSRKGRYSFRELSVYQQPMGGLSQAAEGLRENSLETEGLFGDELTGKISCGKPKLLCLSIPYSEGFRAYVDGERSELINVNFKNMGLFLTEGSHDIYITYSTPYLGWGLKFMLAGLILLLAMLAAEGRSNERA